MQHQLRRTYWPHSIHSYRLILPETVSSHIIGQPHCSAKLLAKYPIVSVRMEGTLWLAAHCFPIWNVASPMGADRMWPLHSDAVPHFLLRMSQCDLWPSPVVTCSSAPSRHRIWPLGLQGQGSGSLTAEALSAFSNSFTLSDTGIMNRAKALQCFHWLTVHS